MEELVRLLRLRKISQDNSLSLKISESRRRVGSPIFLSFKFARYVIKTRLRLIKQKKFKKSVKSRSRYAYYYLRLLVDLGLMTREKHGAKYLYSRNK